ncbi:MAG: universal stress protein [Myxococcota bacterium]
MRWMVGVDARDLSGGAVALARWLATGRLNAIYGVHVVEWVPELHEHFDQTRPNEIRQMAADSLRSLEDDPHFEELGAVLAASAEIGLAEAVATKQAHALIMGRRAPTTGGGLIRLGRVARRMLRQLPVPVVVVPPDLSADQLGPGPVVLGVDLTESCGPAAAFAARVATAMRRSLVLVHAIHPPDRGPYVPADVWDQIMARLHGNDDPSFRTWADRHGVGAAERLERRGPPTLVLPTVAREQRACMLVTGSRDLSGMERLFLSSVGSELAATAPVPVAVVPPR